MSYRKLHFERARLPRDIPGLWSINETGWWFSNISLKNWLYDKQRILNLYRVLKFPPNNLKTKFQNHARTAQVMSQQYQHKTRSKTWVLSRRKHFFYRKGKYRLLHRYRTSDMSHQVMWIALVRLLKQVCWWSAWNFLGIWYQTQEAKPRIDWILRRVFKRFSKSVISKN